MTDAPFFYSHPNTTRLLGSATHVSLVLQLTCVINEDSRESLHQTHVSLQTEVLRSHHKPFRTGMTKLPQTFPLINPCGTLQAEEWKPESYRDSLP